jgi:superfamily II DNA or RNA helicase
VTAAPALRPYQRRAIEDVREAFRTGAKAPLLVVPTGGGKTVVFSHIATSAVAKGKPVLILCHRRELIHQAVAKLEAAGVTPGIIAPGYPATDALVQVGSIQTLAARLQRGIAPPPADLIILDECHHATASTWRAVLSALPKARILGVTATPCRADGKGLGIEGGGIFDALVMGPSVQELIDGGFLNPTRVFAPKVGPDLTGIGTRAGDFEHGALDQVMRASTITGDAVREYARHAPSQPAICFCCSVAHAEEVAAAFREAGWRAQAVAGTSSTADREKAIHGLATGSVQVLCAAELISEGLDVPAVGAVILLRPTKSLALYLQQVGRGLRPAPGKSHLVVLDHAGNVERHGLIEMPRSWSLASAPKRPMKPGEGPVRSGPGGAREKAERVAGELEEMTEAQKARLSHLRTAPLSKLRDGVASLREMHEIGRARGRKPGWAWHQWRELCARRQAAMDRAA